MKSLEELQCSVGSNLTKIYIVTTHHIFAYQVTHNTPEFDQFTY